MSVGLLLLFVFLIFALFLFVLHAVLIFGLVHIEPDFAHAVFVADLFNCGFYDDIVFIDGDIFHVIERYSEHFVVAHADELELLWSDVEFSVVDSFEWHFFWWIEFQLLSGLILAYKILIICRLFLLLLSYFYTLSQLHIFIDIHSLDAKMNTYILEVKPNSLYLRKTWK